MDLDDTMSATATPDRPGGWTLSAIAAAQIADARARLLDVIGCINRDDDATAGDELAAIIRQLEAAQRHLA